MATKLLSSRGRKQQRGGPIPILHMTENYYSNTARNGFLNGVSRSLRMDAVKLFRPTLILILTLASITSLSAVGAESNARSSASGSAETVNVIQASFVPRVITNVIEVRVPTNVFINVYRTNQFAVSRTNVFDVYRTNWMTATLTNTIPVDLTRTNLVTRYQTNLHILTQTNWITRYQTNLNTLTLTNWETMLVFKTNWLTRPATNLVQIDLPAGNGEPKIDNAVAAPVPASKDTLILEARRTAKPSANGQAEIALKLKSEGDETPTFVSQEWKVERADNSVLLFGRGAEFKREVPLGPYKVEVKVRSDENSSPIRVRGNFEVTRDDVIQSKPAGLVNAR
jgi:hypothetical protein